MNLMFREGVLLALAPVVAFCAALMFENGYADVFGISHELIDIDLRTMLISVAFIVLACSPFGIYCYFFFRLGTKKKRETRWWAVRMLLFLPILIGLYTSSFTSVLAYIGLGALLITNGFSVVVVAWKARKVGWDVAMSQAADSEGIKEFGERQLSTKQPNFLDGLIGCAVILFLLMIVAFMIMGVGGGVARLKAVYPSFEMDGKVFVILSGYGDRFVLGGVKNNHFDGTTAVIPKNSEKLINVKSRRYDEFYLKE